MERGQPALAKNNTLSLLQTSFFQEERIRIASPNGEGSMCMPAGKYEAHAFALKDGKLVHIYLQRSMRSEELKGMTEQIKKQFNTMIATAKWD